MLVEDCAPLTLKVKGLGLNVKASQRTIQLKPSQGPQGILVFLRRRERVYAQPTVEALVRK